MLTAAPAGAVIWLLGNIEGGGQNLAAHIAGALNPLGWAIGLDGVILLAYVIAIPGQRDRRADDADGVHGAGMMTDLTGFDELRALLIDKHGWTLLTAVNLMLFSLLHNPCATTIITIYKETLSAKWAAIGALMPLALAFAVSFLTATVARLAFGF